MRITTLEFEDSSDEAPLRNCGIDVPLRRRAASLVPLEAAYWQKVLDLVTHLQSDGTEHELWADLMYDELLLREPQPIDLSQYLQMERFMKEEWRVLTAGSATSGDRLSRVVRWRPKPVAEMSVRVEWCDGAPLPDGLPEMHYKFQVKRPGKTGSEDASAKTLVEAGRIICEAFGW